MSEVDNTPNSLDLEKIGFGTKQAAISFLIQFILIGPSIALSSLVFNNAVAGILSWLIVFYINIYLLYHTSKSKNTLDYTYINTEMDRQAVLYDYQCYLNIKYRLGRMFYRTILAIGALLIFLIFRKLAAVLSIITCLFILIQLIFIYWHLPQFIALYYLMRQHLDINPQQIENALAIEWQKTTAFIKSDVEQDIIPAPVATPVVPLVHVANEPPQPSSPIQNIQPQPAKRELSAIQKLLKLLREQIAELSVTQLRPIHALIEVLQYLETQRRTMPIVHRKALNKIIAQLERDLTDDLQHYMSYSESQRSQYQTEAKIIPDVWFRRQIKNYTQQLIENTNFVYERDLNAFKDHQKFLYQKFTPIESFKTISLRPYSTPSLAQGESAPKPTNASDEK